MGEGRRSLPAREGPLAVRLRLAGRLAEDAGEGVAETAGGLVTARQLHLDDRLAGLHIAQGEAHAARALVGVKGHAMIRLELPAGVEAGRAEP